MPDSAGSQSQMVRTADGELTVGSEQTLSFEVADQRVTDVGGTIGARVLSTPAMIAEMERAASRLAYAHMPEGKATVGFEVCIKHVAAAIEGAACTAHARVSELDGRKLRFDVEVTEGERTIGVGTHERRVIDVGGVASGAQEGK